jgi:hypothetical protein
VLSPSTKKYLLVSYYLQLGAIMSLSALLLGGEPPVKASKKRKSKEQEPAVSIDDGLDALFKSSVRVHGPDPASYY